MTPNIGIDENKRVEIAKGLSKLLAETYTLYLKTHKYHWNVTGRNFHDLHLLFETHYTDLALAVDNIAERIRVLGVKAPGSYKEFSELSSIKEDTSSDITSTDMIKNLLHDHEVIIATAKDVITMTEGANDEGTAGMMGTRLEYHEKTAWMLRSSLE